MVIEELRIGNYVEYNGCTGVVCAIHSPMPCEDEHFRGIGVVELILRGIVTARIDEIKPIPLTEELLLRFGFELDDEDEDKYIISGDVCDYILEKTFDGTYIIGVNHGDNTLYFSWDIIHMHQLQNIIYSLTGQELEIKK